MRKCLHCECNTSTWMLTRAVVALMAWESKQIFISFYYMPHMHARDVYKDSSLMRLLPAARRGATPQRQQLGQTTHSAACRKQKKCA
jgi:hypothetical protein